MSLYVVPLLIFTVLFGLAWLCLPTDRTTVGQFGKWFGWLALLCLGCAVVGTLQSH